MSLIISPPTLSPNESGEWVIYLQNLLNASDHASLALDGSFGANTEAAVKDFQTRSKIAVTGIVNEETWKALDTAQKSPHWLNKLPLSLNLTGVAGADTMSNVTNGNIVQATKLLGTKPRFWGRYFVGRDAEYKGALENKVLHDNGIRVVPVCRETNLIGGDETKGEIIGTKVADDVLVTFGEEYLAANGGAFYIFLDTEPDPEPALSTEYYLGWSKAVVGASKLVRFLPAVYINQSDDRTATALHEAIKKGAECHGLWVANYGTDSSFVAPWRKIKAPEPLGVNFPVLLHQYAGDISNGIYDFNEINPYLDFPDSLILNRLILPPAN